MHLSWNVTFKYVYLFRISEWILWAETRSRDGVPNFTRTRLSLNTSFQTAEYWIPHPLFQLSVIETLTTRWPIFINAQWTYISITSMPLVHTFSSLLFVLLTLYKQALCKKLLNLKLLKVPMKWNFLPTFCSKILKSMILFRTGT